MNEVIFSAKRWVRRAYANHAYRRVELENFL
jgi:hypothetical protein